MIYFLTNRGGFLNVWAIRFDPTQGRPIGEPFEVTTFNSPRQMIQGLEEISLSRERLVLPVTETSGNISMLENLDK